ncbi:glycosyltransferase [uncultured Maribacter sp.]|uniref:glycosyltransferase n=1 Tax=uncultured Maribacter sp. TaxID=431308 RepID=UPI00262B3EEA|nr:glycosyltransferase [uncultured Maribacter sp.]
MPVLLQINTEINYGSTGKIAEEIGHLAQINGWESFVAFGRKKRKSTSKTIYFGNRLDTYLHVLRTRIFDTHGTGSKRTTKKLISEIEKIKPNVIHLHNLHGYYINLKYLFNYLEKKEIPIVCTLHDCWTMTGHCTHFENIKCNKWMTECHSCPQKNVYPQSIFLDNSRKNYQLKKKYFLSLKNLTIVPVSFWLNNVVKQSFLKNHNTEVILNGVDLSIFKPVLKNTIRKKNNLNGVFIILGVASVWSENKGLNDFLKLSKLLTNNEKIVLIGLNKKQLKKLPSNILGIARTESKEELAEWYSEADVYINTSVEESFGLTTAEAMSCGTPSIVYNATACPEMITPEVGIVAKKNNIDDLKKGIEVIKKNKSKSYLEHCKKRAVQFYDKNERYYEYINLYNKVKNS